MFGNRKYINHFIFIFPSLGLKQIHGIMLLHYYSLHIFIQPPVASSLLSPITILSTLFGMTNYIQTLIQRCHLFIAICGDTLRVPVKQKHQSVANSSSQTSMHPKQKGAVLGVDYIISFLWYSSLPVNLTYWYQPDAVCHEISYRSKLSLVDRHCIVPVSWQNLNLYCTQWMTLHSLR